MGHPRPDGCDPELGVSWGERPPCQERPRRGHLRTQSCLSTPSPCLHRHPPHLTRIPCLHRHLPHVTHTLCTHPTPAPPVYTDTHATLTHHTFPLSVPTSYTRPYCLHHHPRLHRCLCPWLWSLSPGSLDSGSCVLTRLSMASPGSCRARWAQRPSPWPSLQRPVVSDPVAARSQWMVGTWAPSSCDPLAGKTTLIKALTGDAAVQPRDQLFATLDVTAHAGSLPSRMAVIYMDTIGFLSQLPHSLIESFSATLEDVAHSVSRVGPRPSHFKYQPAGAWRPHHHTTRDGGGVLSSPHHTVGGPGPVNTVHGVPVPSQVPSHGLSPPQPLQGADVCSFLK